MTATKTTARRLSEGMKAVVHDRYGPPEVLRLDVTSFAVGDRAFGVRAGANPAFLCVRESRVVAHVPAGLSFEEAAATCKDLFEAGDYRPVIDRTYPLDDVVEAHRHVGTGQKIGNVVLTVAP